MSKVIVGFTPESSKDFARDASFARGASILAVCTEAEVKDKIADFVLSYPHTDMEYHVLDATEFIPRVSIEKLAE